MFFNHAIVLSVLILSFIFVIVCCLSEWKLICAGFLIVYVYLHCSWRSYSETKKGLARTRNAAFEETVLHSEETRSYIYNLESMLSLLL